MLYRRVGDRQVPALGFGTWQLKDEVACRMVEAALGMGYRHLDTASIYQNEEAVGKAMAASSVPRADIFLTTKVWHTELDRAHFLPAVDASLARLGTDHVDLLLVHWPNPQVPMAETIEQLLDAKRSGRARAIGISNHNVTQMQEAIRLAGASELVVNQAEYHPLLSQRTLLAAMRQQGMPLTAYCPLAQGRVLSQPLICELAAKHHKQPSQISLRWLLQQDNILTIPGTSSEAHAASNLDIFDFSLSEEEMASIDALGGDTREVNPAFAPVWDRP